MIGILVLNDAMELRKDGAVECGLLKSFIDIDEGIKVVKVVYLNFFVDPCGMRVTLGSKSRVGNDIIGFDVRALGCEFTPFEKRLFDFSV